PPASVRSCGVSDFRTSTTGAKAETISDTGAVTDLSLPFPDHTARMDSESLPTGMLNPSAGQNAMPTARTVSYSAASSCAYPQAAIQLADRATSESCMMRAAAMLVIASAMAMRPEAGASMTASGVRSPTAIASPVVSSSEAAVTAQSATGTCHGPTI